MASGVPAYVNHRMLIWARETAGMELEGVARRLQTTVERVVDWESGTTLPTMRQARMLASLYKRPLSLLYFDEPPVDPPRPTDFRATTSRGEGSFPPSLIFAMRDAYDRSEVAVRLLRGLGEESKSFRLKATLEEDTETVGARLRKWTRLSVEEQIECGTAREFYNLLRKRIEDGGVLTFQMTDVPENTATGFSFADSPMPVISINNKTNPVRRLFTLFHELSHIALRQGGLCELSYVEDDSPNQEIETFCNRAAGAALLPRGTLLAHPLVKRHIPGQDWEQNHIVELAGRFCVSKYVLLIRLQTVNKATRGFVDRRLLEYRNQEERELPTSHFVQVQDKVASTNGLFFSRLVLESYFSNHLSLRDVSDLLDLNLEYLDPLADKIYRTAS